MALPEQRCRLSPRARAKVYDIYDRYQRILDDNSTWYDEMDMVIDATQMVLSKEQEFTYDRIYVDEIQDLTQAEIGLLFLRASNALDALFLAGDPAQAVSKGVDFRFEEVRALVYQLSNGQQKIEKYEKLVSNFRSHKGILDVANLVVLRRLHEVFPGGAVKLPYDEGLVTGPRPGLIRCNEDDIVRMISANQHIRILTRDSYRNELRERLGAIEPDSRDAVWGIVEAKGLEFSDVVIVDFFSSLNDPSLLKHWKNILLGASSKGKKSTSSHDFPQTMELELKLFYTAITRACRRLLFIETKSTSVFETFRRDLQDRNLAESMTPSDAMEIEGSRIMTKDDWRVEGLDMASLAEDCDLLEEKKAFLSRAISSFAKAKSSELEERARTHLKAAELEDETRRALLQNEDSSASLHQACQAAQAYLSVGMTDNAATVVVEYCDDQNLATNLARRIKKLSTAFQSP